MTCILVVSFCDTFIDGQSKRTRRELSVDWSVLKTTYSRSTFIPETRFESDYVNCLLCSLLRNHFEYQSMP